MKRSNVIMDLIDWTEILKFAALRSLSNVQKVSMKEFFYYI